MTKIPGYTIIDQIGETRLSVTFRAQKDDVRPGVQTDTVRIKVLKGKRLSSSDVAVFKQEYSNIKEMDLESILRFRAIEKHNESFAIIFDDFDGIKLKEIIDSEKLDIETFLKIACPLSSAIGQLHKANIIHKQIKPHNILFNRNTGKIKISDLGMSTILLHENKEIYHQDTIKNILPYISPEQTGRMNRTIDHRTDLYSMGITFYEMLTGCLPFSFDDPMEIIHAHIAKSPLSPGSLNSTIPAVISDIIMKLLSKTAEDRYQNSFGLLADLNICLEQLEGQNKITPFQLAQKDVPFKFSIPQKLYGRYDEVKQLRDSFERVAGGNKEIVLVSGHPGIGKSALIDEINKTITSKRGYFSSGKYDQFKNDAPYSAIIQSLMNLVRQILSESGERLIKWKGALLDALGANANVIIDVVPAVKMITGEQPDVPTLGTEETQNRFNLVFENFIRIFAKPEHPLVLFLDDLQWADSASLKLIQRLLIDPDLHNLLLIGAYRNNEVFPSHIFAQAIELIKKNNVRLTEISLRPFDRSHITEMLTDALKCEKSMASTLAEPVFRKTNGNPFFVNEFIISIHANGLLESDPAVGWRWDINKINQMQVTDNVLSIISEKITRLNDKTRDILKTCTCIGNRFTLETLSVIHNKDEEEIFYYLSEAIAEGFIVRVDDIYLFQHNRIQKAVYSLIPEDDKNRLHFRVGRFELDSSNEREQYEKIFYIVNQLNHGIEFLSDYDEKNELAHLNLKAGRKAKDSTAYDVAVKYLRIGKKLQSEKGWENNYEFTRDLCTELGECEYLTGKYENAENIFNEILEKAKSNIDRAKYYSLMMIMYTTIGKVDQALALGIKGLKLFGVRFSLRSGKIRIVFEFLWARWNQGLRKIEDIDNAPKLTEPEKLEVTTLLINMGTPAYYVNTKLFAASIMRGVGIGMKNGFPDFAPFGIITFGMIAGAGFGFYDTGYRYGEVGLRLTKKYNNKMYFAKAYFTFAYFVLHMRKHARGCIDYFSRAIKYGLECGDFIFTGHAINAMATYRIFLGDNCDEIFRDFDRHREFFKKLKDPFIDYNYRGSYQMFLNFKYGPDEYRDDHIKRLKEVRAAGNTLGLFLCLIKMNISFYHYGNYSECYKISEELDRIIDIVLGTLYVVEHYFYYSLAVTAMYLEKSVLEKKRYQKILKQNRKKLKKYAKSCPENFLHKYLLVEAEMARITGNNEKAADLYNQAIKSAAQNEYTQNEAIANELAAKFYMERGYSGLARTCMIGAVKAYNKWGAAALVRGLEAKYPEYFAETFYENSVEGEEQFSQLDYSTIVNSLQMISTEIIFKNLLKKLMKIVIESAGAQRGVFILQKGDLLSVEAEIDLSDNENKINEEKKEEPIVIRTVAVDQRNDLLLPLLNLVMRIQKYIVLDDASKEGEFISDSYVTKNQLKSILCLPVIRKSKTVGLLYLENNIAAGAFTHDRIAVLELLASQAAISLENAVLYEELDNHRNNLEDIVKERTEELADSNEQLRLNEIKIRELNEQLEKKVVDKTEKLKDARDEIVKKEYISELADITTGTLHNVKNILNSIKVSTEAVGKILTGETVNRFKKANSMLKENIDNIEEFICNDPKGKKLMRFYLKIEDSLNNEGGTASQHYRRLLDKINAIEQIITAQQGYGGSPIVEDANIADVIEDALTMQMGSIENQDVKIIKQLNEAPKISVQKTKLMHILINLIKNATESMTASAKDDRLLSFSTDCQDSSVFIKVRDMGHGISSENIGKMFTHGFTTKKDGHGFGLHSSLIYMKEMGGEMWAESEGEGKGATFILKFPAVAGDESSS